MTLDDLRYRVEEVERLMRTRVVDERCTAERPHPDGLVFQRGPNVYTCRCGQTYVKAGNGLLREE